MTLLLGIIIGIFLSAIAMAWDACKSRRPKFWIDDNYKLHLIKRKH